MPAPRTLLVAVVCASALLPGCGGNDERDVRATLERYATAIQRKDFQTICDEILSEKLIEKLRSANYPCETALKNGFEDVDKPTLVVKSVKVDGDNASAVARSDAANQEPSEDTIRLTKEGDRWKIVALSSA